MKTRQFFETRRDLGDRQRVWIPVRFSLAPGCPGHNAGATVSNFTDGYTGSAPDIGAHESGTPPMQFGGEAYLPPGPAPEAAK